VISLFTASVTVGLTVIFLALVAVGIDTVAAIIATNRKYEFSGVGVADFTVLVPIWGNTKYLENIEYLAQYGDKVILCTTGDESVNFYASLQDIAGGFGFRLFIDESTGLQQASNKRATSGTTRDRLIRNALEGISTTYVVPLDADSTTILPFDQLVGELVHRDLDIASIRLVTRNTSGVLAKLQRLEYRIAMQLRFLAPWMISGACHVAKTVVLRDVMRRHSLFFQGNDVEAGLIAEGRGYKIGHIPFEVVTTVPSDIRSWWRQRLAWSGGEFRLFIVNAKFVFKHPFFWVYGALISILAFPLRWYTIVHPGWMMLIAAVLYILAIIYLHARSKSAWMLVMPFYTLFSSLIMAPFGIVMYGYMVYKHKNWGIIRPQLSQHAPKS
jgi:hypothetical protein